MYSNRPWHTRVRQQSTQGVNLIAGTLCVDEDSNNTHCGCSWSLYFQSDTTNNNGYFFVKTRVFQVQRRLLFKVYIAHLPIPLDRILATWRHATESVQACIIRSCQSRWCLIDLIKIYHLYLKHPHMQIRVVSLVRNLKLCYYGFYTWIMLKRKSFISWFTIFAWYK